MTNKANPAAIGLFIVGAIIILIVGVLVFTSDTWFSKNHRFVVFFNESINGLNIGAPIKLSGVQIGQVTEINVERSENLKTVLVGVVFEINADRITRQDPIQSNLGDPDDIKKLIDSGLRLQLQLNSLLTGLLFIEAQFLPDTPYKLYGLRSEMMEIPSIPSSSATLQKTLKEFLLDIETIDFKQLFTNVQKIIDNIEKITGSEQTQSTLTSLNASMIDLQSLLSTLNQEAGPVSQDLRKTIKHTDQFISTLDDNTRPLVKELRQAVQALESTLANIDTLTSPDSPIGQDLRTALQEFTRAARSTRLMMDYLERHPDALIYGKDQDTGGRQP